MGAKLQFRNKLFLKNTMPEFAILYSDKLKDYDLGHVLTQDRYQSFVDLFHEKLGHSSDFKIIAPPYATNTELALVHTEEYIRRVERFDSKDPLDTPLSPPFVKAAKLLAGAGKYAGELVKSGQYQKAFVVGGGVQHARRDREKGFGVFSDIGLCAQNLMENFGVKRILIVDTDAHAGDGIYEIFSTEPKVLYISLHQDPLTLYPGKGFIHDIGRGAGEGYSVNIPLPPGSGDMVYEHALSEIFVPLSEAFEPEIILMVDGSDPHYTDRITQMGLTLQGIKQVGTIIGRMADKLCDGKLVDFIGSGYSSNLEVVSLGWLASIGGVTNTEIEFEEPQPPPTGFEPEARFDESKKTIQLLHAILSPYWKCFAS